MGKGKDDDKDDKTEIPNELAQRASGQSRNDRVGSAEDPPPS